MRGDYCTDRRGRPDYLLLAVSQLGEGRGGRNPLSLPPPTTPAILSGEAARPRPATDPHSKLEGSIAGWGWTELLGRGMDRQERRCFNG